MLFIPKYNKTLPLLELNPTTPKSQGHCYFCPCVHRQKTIIFSLFYLKHASLILHFLIDIETTMQKAFPHDAIFLFYTQNLHVTINTASLACLDPSRHLRPGTPQPWYLAQNKHSCVWGLGDDFR